MIPFLMRLIPSLIAIAGAWVLSRCIGWWFDG